jgi:flagellar basal-body rod protein FlgF
MADGIYTALSGALAQQHSLDVVANNVANAATAGFRGDRAVFGELLAGAQKDAASAPGNPNATRTDHFVQVKMNALDTSSGALRHTGNTLDLALQSDGYFAVRTPQGERLTRSGNFMLREDAVLTTVDGHPVLDDRSEPIVFPLNTKNIEVLSDGTIRADNQEIAKLGIKNVADPTQLTREGTTTYAAAQGATLTNPERVSIAQGHLEQSNVNVVGSLNELITINRAFDAIQRVIENFQQIDQRTARDLGSRNG